MSNHATRPAPTSAFGCFFFASCQPAVASANAAAVARITPRIVVPPGFPTNVFATLAKSPTVATRIADGRRPAHGPGSGASDEVPPSLVQPAERARVVRVREFERDLVVEIVDLELVERPDPEPGTREQHQPEEDDEGDRRSLVQVRMDLRDDRHEARRE